MTQIKCYGCNACIYPGDDEDAQAYASKQGWSYRFNFLSKEKDKNEFRCLGCTQKRLEEMQKNMGFRTLPPQTAATPRAVASKPKPVEKPPPPPRAFQRAMDPDQIGKIYWERFGGSQIYRKPDYK